MDKKYEVTIYNSIQEKIVYFAEAESPEKAAKQCCGLHTRSNEWMGLKDITIREIRVREI
jgi:hypothetical protein